jgi:hypothetical protein
VLSHLTLATFMAGVDLSQVAAAIGDLLERAPKVEISALAREPA